ncbi:MAG TPA: hydrolase 2, exosortase A system-associated [Noviherbaspirillum sp.]|nr:hydrolase 2, exosortase A system-associated [Noviherbaspirillum sp.]
MRPQHPPALPFFLHTGHGKRFCLYHKPASGIQCRGAILYVPPFGEEMNKARRIAALQARAFSAMGFGILLLDLYGCGDSEGEFRDARWQIWKEDLAAAKAWLQANVSPSVSLWGTRLGALLALDYASTDDDLDVLILWQPVLEGKSFLTQFLRLFSANEMLRNKKKQHGMAATPREALIAGESLEVGGYEIAPALAAAIDELNATPLITARNRIYWFEIVPDVAASMPPARLQAANIWKQKGSDLHLHTVQCAPFWATQEVAECPELIAAVTQQLTDVAYAL